MLRGNRGIPSGKIARKDSGEEGWLIWSSKLFALWCRLWSFLVFPIYSGKSIFCVNRGLSMAMNEEAGFNSGLI